MGRDHGIEQQGGIVQDVGGSGWLRQLDRPTPHVMRSRVQLVSGVPREGTRPPLRDPESTAGRKPNSLEPAIGETITATIGRTIAAATARCSTLAPITIRRLGWPAVSRSAGACGRAITAAITGSTIRGMFRLPYAPAGLRWIRYYDDALLVNAWSGEVVDVIRNFFW